MNFSNRLYAFGTSGNPVVQVVSLIAFGVVLIGVVLMGAVILAFVFGLAVVAAIVFSVRLWWLRRRLGRHRPSDAVEAATAGRLIEAEYTVLKERSTRRTPRD